ncbi:hypothetical protein L9W97_01845 [Vibrio aestuarianus]|uniref:hypothetical protein n=1 Tax=Vibrio aestuarianus TaxID=28171 RepID=UPI00237C6FD6|nr:hypothetical protein [Vibrio aestuarianus]MDE1323862.1 hypothetical protein [Vibrio aestuarianus]
MTVTYQVLNLSQGGGSNNLLINPRGKINQANENDGVLSAGQYFCDGWKAGGSGAEVYRDSDGFRLISGSIVQLVPNNLDVGRQIRGNMDIISGTPIIRINGGGDDELSNTQPYITFEIIGDNSKFTRLILSESVELPVYQQSLDELVSCEKYLKIISSLHVDVAASEYYWLGFDNMIKVPAISIIGGTLGANSIMRGFGVNYMTMTVNNDSVHWCEKLIIDARP